MEQEKKSRIYNVIILDKSGSMSSIRKQAVDGVNETLGGIRSAARLNPGTEHYVTLVAFCGCETVTIIDTQLIDKVENITPEQYRPCCMTPLYDAVGNTITRLHTRLADEPMSVASVTIITDGYENASREFTHTAIKALIDAYKSEGWLFAYIGADHDVESVAYSLHIDNALEFDKTDEGVHKMACITSNSLSSWSSEMSAEMEDMKAMPSISAEEKYIRLRKLGKNFFKK